MLPLIVLLLAASGFPTGLKTAWMEPDAFHIAIGMKRATVEKALASGGWKTTAGKVADHRILEYGEGKTLTLSFHRDRLEWIRFELVGFVPSVVEAFAEQQRELAKKFGKPRRKSPSPSMLIYDHTRPNIFVVYSVDRKSGFGKQGLGFLVIRYFDPGDDR